MDKDVLRLFLPEGILDYFTITKVQELPNKKDKSKDIHIYLEERNELRSVSNAQDYESKGYYSAKTVQDFPVRGKAVYLIIKRRRWRHKENHNNIVSNDYTLFAEGVKLTQELSDFFKINR